MTRVPVPVVRDFSPVEFSRSSAWFPFVGLFIGALVSMTIYICAHRNATLATAIGLLVWVWTTGALHLDGLADLTDALAAAHRDKEKFFAVLADPHIGALGVVSIVMMLILKATGLAEISIRDLFAFPLIPAWARLGPLAWSRWLKPLKPGHGERFAWHLNVGWIVFWTVGAARRQRGAGSDPVRCACCHCRVGPVAEMAPRRDDRRLPRRRSGGYRAGAVVCAGPGLRHSGKPAVTKKTSSQTAATA